MKFNATKFNNLVHYICYKCNDPASLGATKLNKILWYSDLSAYLSFGKSITGEKYIKRQFGPVPYHILPAIEYLSDSGKIVVRTDMVYFGKNKREFISLKKPEISVFSSEEISIVDEITGIICSNHTAKSISGITHDKIWELAEIGEEIPYYTIYASDLGEINEEDIQWAKTQLKRAA